MGRFIFSKERFHIIFEHIYNTQTVMCNINIIQFSNLKAMKLYVNNEINKYPTHPPRQLLCEESRGGGKHLGVLLSH